jgi:hypothetical protein
MGTVEPKPKQLGSSSSSPSYQPNQPLSPPKMHKKPPSRTTEDAGLFCFAFFKKGFESQNRLARNTVNIPLPKQLSPRSEN